MGKKNVFAAAALAAMLVSPNLAMADPIEGMWLTGDKALLKISTCGSSFCIDVADGEYKGKRSGKMKRKGSTYTGKLKQFSTGITFAGVATISGRTMKLIAKKFGITVKRDTWKKQ